MAAILEEPQGGHVGWGRASRWEREGDGFRDAGSEQIGEPDFILRVLGIHRRGGVRGGEGPAILFVFGSLL